MRLMRGTGMGDGYTRQDLEDLSDGMSAHTIVLRLLLRESPDLALRIRGFALSHELYQGISERAAKIIQEDLLQLTDFVKER